MTEYHDRNVDRFAADTLDLDMSRLYARFLRFIPEGGRILDAGCGPGRGAKAFESMGYKVTAFDASEAMVRLAAANTGSPVLRMTRAKTHSWLPCFDDVAWTDEFDGVWARTLLLHVPREYDYEVMGRLVRAMKVNGVLFASFKLGQGERTAPDGRLFVDHSIESAKLLMHRPELMPVHIWTTRDVRAGRSDERWVNAIAVKMPWGRLWGLGKQVMTLQDRHDERLMRKYEEEIRRNPPPISDPESPQRERDQLLVRAAESIRQLLVRGSNAYVRAHMSNAPPLAMLPAGHAEAIALASAVRFACSNQASASNNRVLARYLAELEKAVVRKDDDRVVHCRSPV